MDEQVSAFAVYKANVNKKSKVKKKKPKKIKVEKISKEIPVETIKKAAKKIKKEPKKIAKGVGKKKSLKKKKDKIEKKPNIKKERISPVPKRVSPVPKKESNPEVKENPVIVAARNERIPIAYLDPPEQIPRLVAAPCQNVEEGYYSSEASSGSSSKDGFDFTPVETDSSLEALKVFKWMIAPYNPEEFLKRVWEKKPLHIARKKPNYYKELITTPMIDEMLRKENIQFTKNIDITSYVNSERHTHNPEGRAHPHLVWDFYLNGCSIRLLNPQTYMPELHSMNATLQEFFHSFVGANAYLTPPDSQGFAPHYDDIEAFVLQTEGKKRWRIYKPLSDNGVLPRVSSKNFEQNEIGEPILEVTLEAGDMLYFPRGYIHQAVTVDGEHSLHVTVSMYQNHSFADLFEKMLLPALHFAAEEEISLRRGLPFDLFDHFGLVNSDLVLPRRQDITNWIMCLFDKIKEYLPIDDAVDQMSKAFQHAALPPVLTEMEKIVTVFGESDRMLANGKVINRVEIGLDTGIRLLRKNILRVVAQEKIRLYYYAENSLEYHGSELPFLEIADELAPGIETLIRSYPKYVPVELLDIQDNSDKLQLADALWGRGLIMTEFPLESIDDD